MIHLVIAEKDKYEIILGLIESRKKEEREQVRNEYNTLFNADMMTEIENYIPQEYKQKFKELFETIPTEVGQKIITNY